MDEGAPVAYLLVEKGVPVLCSGGKQVGTVHHVVAAPEEDIFHGIVIRCEDHGKRFVPAEDVASLHEHGVDLRIDAAAIALLPRPGGAAPVFKEDPAETNWAHWTRKLTLRKDWTRER